MQFCKEILQNVMVVNRSRIVEIFKKSANKSSQEMTFKGFKYALAKLGKDYYNGL